MTLSNIRSPSATLFIRLEARLQPNIGFTLRRDLAAKFGPFGAPKPLNGFRWNLEYITRSRVCPHIQIHVVLRQKTTPTVIFLRKNFTKLQRLATSGRHNYALITDRRKFIRNGPSDSFVAKIISRCIDPVSRYIIEWPGRHPMMSLGHAT